jgi:hypothetical protein
LANASQKNAAESLSTVIHLKPKITSAALSAIIGYQLSTKTQTKTVAKNHGQRVFPNAFFNRGLPHTVYRV